MSDGDELCRPKLALFLRRYELFFLRCRALLSTCEVPGSLFLQDRALLSTCEDPSSLVLHDSSFLCLRVVHKVAMKRPAGDEINEQVLLMQRALIPSTSRPTSSIEEPIILNPICAISSTDRPLRVLSSHRSFTHP
jgi:hypothetical protein